MSLDAAREANSRANTQLGNATTARATAFFDLEHARETGDPYEITHAENVLRLAETAHATALERFHLAGARLKELHDQGEY